MSAAERIERALTATLPRYLPRQRWFGDKARSIGAVTVVDLGEAGAEADPFWLSVVDVRFADGDDARYFVPVAVRSSVASGRAPMAELGDGNGSVYDAFDVPEFLKWAIDSLATGAVLPTRRGRFEWTTLPDSGGVLSEAGRGPARLSSAEQSNSSVRYGDAVFMKLFRRLREGIDPDEEIGRFLATRSSFRRFPTPLGTGRYVGLDGSSFPVALAQAFVPSVGDGWEVTLRELATVADRSASAMVMRRLGARTGEMHVALANGSDDGQGADEAFRPIPVTERDARRWEDRVNDDLARVHRSLTARRGDVPAESRAGIDALTTRMGELTRRSAGFRELVGSWQTRVHGDFHLGQTLRTPDSDWVILDFEGEPARSIEERRMRTSPLKDVAGMLRSFGYAAGAALRSLPDAERDGAAASSLADWERTARRKFLDGYLAEIGRGPVVPVPTGGEAFSAGLSAWELDKALYEVAYELSNRPDWLDLPIRALLGSEVSSAG